MNIAVYTLKAERPGIILSTKEHDFGYIYSTIESLMQCKVASTSISSALAGSGLDIISKRMILSSMSAWTGETLSQKALGPVLQLSDIVLT